MKTPNWDKRTDNQKDYLKSRFVWENLVWKGLYGQKRFGSSLLSRGSPSEKDEK